MGTMVPLSIKESQNFVINGSLVPLAFIIFLKYRYLSVIKYWQCFCFKLQYYGTYLLPYRLAHVRWEGGGPYGTLFFRYRLIHPSHFWVIKKKAVDVPWRISSSAVRISANFSLSAVRFTNSISGTLRKTNKKVIIRTCEILEKLMRFTQVKQSAVKKRKNCKISRYILILKGVTSLVMRNTYNK